MGSRMPQMDGRTVTNVYNEHEFAIDITFGNSSALTYTNPDATVAKTTSTTFTVTLPRPYNRITGFEYAWAKASGAAPLAVQITTDSVSSAGTFVFTTIATNTAGTPTAPVITDRLWLRVRVSDSPLNTKFTGTSP